MRPQPGYLVLCAAGTMLGAQQCWAAEWQWLPNANVGASYADNPRLRADGDDSSSGAVGELGGTLRRLTQRTELSLQPRVRSSRYSDDESLDSDDQYLTAVQRWQGERSQWRTELGLTRDTTLTSELGSTGLVQGNRRHEAMTFSVAPTLLFTERLSGGVQMYLMDSRYPDAGSTALVDYRYQALSLFSSLALTESGSSAGVTAQLGELSADIPFGGVTRDGTLRLMLSAHPWEQWEWSLSAGPSFVDTRAGSDSGVVFESHLDYRAERWSLTGMVGRSQSPTGRGVLTRRDSTSLTLRRAITERLSGTLSAQWIRTEDLLPQGRAATYVVDYARVDLGASWRVARHWSLSLQIAGNTQQYQTAPERAEGYRASLSMVWNGQPQSL